MLEALLREVLDIAAKRVRSLSLSYNFNCSHFLTLSLVTLSGFALSILLYYLLSRSLFILLFLSLSLSDSLSLSHSIFPFSLSFCSPDADFPAFVFNKRICSQSLSLDSDS